MENKENIEDLYFTRCHDAFSWVHQAEIHLIPAKIIHQELMSILHKCQDISDELTDKVSGLIGSYMLLISLSFENLIKVLII